MRRAQGGRGNGVTGEARAVERHAVARGAGHDGRLRVDGGGQVGPPAPPEAVPRVAVGVRGVLGRPVVVPRGAEYLRAAPGDGADLPPPVRATARQLSRPASARVWA